MKSETDTPKSTPAARRHPLQVTASRIRDAIKDYPAIFDGPSRAVAEVLARRLDEAVDAGVPDGKPAYGPPENTGQAFDQRVKR